MSANHYVDKLCYIPVTNILHALSFILKLVHINWSEYTYLWGFRYNNSVRVNYILLYIVCRCLVKLGNVTSLRAINGLLHTLSGILFLHAGVVIQLVALCGVPLSLPQAAIIKVMVMQYFSSVFITKCLIGLEGIYYKLCKSIWVYHNLYGKGFTYSFTWCFLLKNVLSTKMYSSGFRSPNVLFYRY